VRNRDVLRLPVHASRVTSIFPGQTAVLNDPVILSPDTVKVPSTSFAGSFVFCVKTVSPDTTPSATLDTRLNLELVTSTVPLTRAPSWVRPNTTTPLPSPT
jgi:hypothetical protein